MQNMPRSFSRAVATVALWAVALLPVIPRVARAEEAPAEDAAAAAEGAEVAADADTAQEVVEGMITAPGGIPAEPMDPESAIDTVKAAMAGIKTDASGIGAAYTIQFGDTFDWVQMVSGEWIKGDIKRMREGTMEFDSDKLGLLKLDFGDIALVHSPQVNTYVFDERISATGPAALTEDLVIVQTDEGTKAFSRSNLEGIVEGFKEKDWWSMRLRFGLTLNRGNADQLTYDILFNTRREDEITLLDLNYNATFGRTNGVQNVNRHLGEFLFNVFLGSRWWVTPAFGQLLNDRFQNIQFRATPAAGAGVHIIDAPKVEWDFVTGIGYQYLNYKAPAAGTTNPQHDGVIPLLTWANFDITGDVDLMLSWLTNLVFTTIGNTNHTGRAELGVELTSVLDLNVAYLFLRTEEPAPSDPPLKKNDHQLVIGISLELG